MFSGFCLGGGLFLGHLVALVQRGKQTAQVMFTAPRLVISSILSWVYSLPPACRISRVSSVVMASTPQPKDTSCTRSISFWVVQYLAAAYRRLW